MAGEPGQPGNGRPGLLVAIGGGIALDHAGEPLILGRYVYEAGGRHASLVVIPIASDDPGTGARYQKLFRRLGASAVEVLHPHCRTDADEPSCTSLIEHATGVFFTGGDQFRLAQRLTGTALEEAIVAAHRRGIVVGGTSAGASYLSARMIAFGKSGSTPRQDMVTVERGLGLTEPYIIDQHFTRRNRLGRLLAALVAHPDTIGLGLDEDTAALIDGDSFEVIGNSTITVLDPSRLRATVPMHPDRHDPVCMLDMSLHILVHGATYSLRGRTASPPPSSNSHAPCA